MRKEPKKEPTGENQQPTPGKARNRPPTAHPQRSLRPQLLPQEELVARIAFREAAGHSRPPMVQGARGGGLKGGAREGFQHNLGNTPKEDGREAPGPALKEEGDCSRAPKGVTEAGLPGPYHEGAVSLGVPAPTKFNDQRDKAGSSKATTVLTCKLVVIPH